MTKEKSVSPARCDAARPTAVEVRTYSGLDVGANLSDKGVADKIVRRPAGEREHEWEEQDRLGEYTSMGKRDKFVAELRQLAKDKGLKFQVQKWRGKGRHAMVWVGDEVTTLPSREIDPKTAKKI